MTRYGLQMKREVQRGLFAIGSLLVIILVAILSHLFKLLSLTLTLSCLSLPLIVYMVCCTPHCYTAEWELTQFFCIVKFVKRLPKTLNG